jgi:hypothetical protein
MEEQQISTTDRGATPVDDKNYSTNRAIDESDHASLSGENRCRTLRTCACVSLWNVSDLAVNSQFLIAATTNIVVVVLMVPIANPVDQGFEDGRNLLQVVLVVHEQLLRVVALHVVIIRREEHF